ncbi:MAG: hypothetical protein HWE20_04620 [Gammaproteobacteria bacterium]|nr:hypothetical protein [Gammaproteobacteria bacterium]
MLTKFTMPLLWVLLVAGCGGGSGGNANKNLPEIKKWIYDHYHANYLWNSDIPDDIVIEDHSTAESLMDAMAYWRDRWSYIDDAGDHSAYFDEGQTEGYGGRWRWYQYTQARRYPRLLEVHSLSPANAAGLQRGDWIIEIDGNDLWEVDEQTYYATFDRWRENGEAIVTYERNGTRSRERVGYRVFTLDTVKDEHIQTYGDKKIAYFRLTSFIEPSVDKIVDLYLSYNEHPDLDSIIIDLRHNGGGRTWITAFLTNWLLKNRTDPLDLDAAPMIHYVHNENKRDDDETWTFYSNEENVGLGFKNFVILTTDGTCSASELLISAIQPYAEQLYTVGDTTCGKPVGMEPVEQFDKILSAVTFKTLNALGEGEYFDGIPPDCPAEENLDSPIASDDDPLYAHAISLLTEQRCADFEPVQRARQQQPVQAPSKDLQRWWRPDL